MRKENLFVFVVVVFFFTCIPASYAVIASFEGLGDLSGGDCNSAANDTSHAGLTIVGGSLSVSNRREGFHWTSASGMIGLGDLPGGRFYSWATSVSSNGSIIVGGSASTLGTEAFRWEDLNGNGLVDTDEKLENHPEFGLGDLPGGDFKSYAEGISADGLVIVGHSESAFGTEAFRWTNSSGMVGLGDLPSGKFLSRANHVSANGEVVVGEGNSALGWEAFRWTKSDGMVGLGDLPGGRFDSGAVSVSPDGSVVVGSSESGASTPRCEAFRWTATDGMVGLGDLPGGGFYSCAYDVSENGLVIIGSSESASGVEAFIWDADDGMQSLKGVLVNDYGLDLTGWTLQKAGGISADGLIIVGYGINPQGYTEAWIATIPEPGTVLLLGLGGSVLLTRRRS